MDTVVIVLAKCANTSGQSFGKSFRMRFEEKLANQWFLIYGYAVDLQLAGGASKGQENDSLSSMHGTFSIGSEYPGCPYCYSKSFFQHYCDGIHATIACWDGEQKRVRCPGCRQEMELTGSIESISGQPPQKEER